MTDGDEEWLARRFEAHRAHLRGVAYRLLGSSTEADDAVQEAWIRLSRAGADGVDNLGGWLTTVVARVSLDLLRQRKSRREESEEETSAGSAPATIPDPAAEAELGDAVGMAMLVVLEKLTPAERVAFVLHDLFDVPFDEIAAILGRSSDATRQLASRARRRVQGGTTSLRPDQERQRTVIDAFLRASRAGDFEALLALLDPEVQLRADGAVVRMGGEALVRGREAVARSLSGRARGAQVALVDEAVGLVWIHHGELKVFFAFTLDGERVRDIELVAEPERLGGLHVRVLDG